MNPLYDNIPIELIEKDNWCVFRKEWLPEKQKYTKRPINPNTGHFAKSNDPLTWVPFDDAVRESDQYDGIGFFFDGEHYGVDLDNVASEIQRYLEGDFEENIVADAIETLTSYAEISPSGKGVHIICKGQLPKGGRRKGDVEMYDSGRFFTVTGNTIGPYKMVFDDDMGKINYLHHKFIGEESIPVNDLSQLQQDGNDLSIDEIIADALASKNGTRFELLFQGGWEQVYPSQSEADMAFANDLAFWTARDYEKMDSIFRRSSLYRNKWDAKRGESTYGYQTLARAIQDCRDIYQPFRLHISPEALKGSKKPQKQFTYDDTGNAERFLYAFGDNVLYSYSNRCYYYWTNKMWVEDQLGKIHGMADYIANNIRKEPIFVSDPNDEKLIEKAQDSLNKHVKYTRSYRGKENMLKDMQHHVAIDQSLFDSNGLLFNTHNGYLDLNSGTLMSHEDGKKKYFTRISNTEYVVGATAPLWEKFLNDIFQGNTALIDYMQRAIGYSLSADTSEQVMFILLGNGKNGKSVLLNVLSDVFGGYSMNIQPQTIAVKRGTQNANPDIARLKGARFVTTTEPNKGMQLDEGVVKQITGGDKVTARFLYGRDFEYTPEFKVWMATNYKPVISGTDEGIWRRIVVIPFNYKIPPEQVDKRLVYKLKEELPGVLNWCLKGYQMWRERGLDDEPLEITMNRADYRTEMDIIQRYIQENCMVGGNHFECKFSDLWEDFQSWVRYANEFEGFSMKRFSMELEKHFTKKRKSDGVYFQGLTTKNRLNFSSIPNIR